MTANQPPENDNPQAGGPEPQAGTNPPPAGPQPQPPYGAAGQPPAGQPPQQAPAGYPPAGYPSAEGAFAPQAPPTPKKGSKVKRSLVSVGIAIVVIVVGALVRNGVFDSPAMKVGDCVQQTGEDSVKVVACDSADAQFSVLGIVEKQSQVSMQLGACKAFPETTSAYWEGRENKSGTIYCLKEL